MDPRWAAQLFSCIKYLAEWRNLHTKYRAGLLHLRILLSAGYHATKLQALLDSPHLPVKFSSAGWIDCAWIHMRKCSYCLLSAAVALRNYESAVSSKHFDLAAY